MTGSPCTIRQARPRDLEAILALDRATADAPHWPRAIYQDILSPGVGEAAILRRMLVAEEGQGVLGFGVGSISGSPSELQAELESVAVSERVRRRGIGRALCQGIVDWCRGLEVAEIALEVRCSSAGAIALYRSLGFRSTGRRPRYYADPPDDALLMRLPLRPGAA